MPKTAHPNTSYAHKVSTSKTLVCRILSAVLLAGVILSAFPTLAAEEMTREAALRFMELSAEASPKEIKTRYRQLAQKFHPDVGGSAEKFVELQQAFDVLKEKNANDSAAKASESGVFPMPLHRFSTFFSVPVEHRQELYDLIALWDQSVGIEFDRVLALVANNPNARIDMSAFYDAHLKLVQQRVGNGQIIGAFESLPMLELLRFLNDSKTVGDPLLASYLRELIARKDLTRFARIISVFGISGRISSARLNGKSPLPKTNALLSELPSDPLFLDIFKEVAKKKESTFKESVQLARTGLLEWQDVWREISLRRHFDKKERLLVEEILSHLPKSFSQELAFIQLRQGSNAVVEMPLLRQYAVKMNANELSWSDFDSGSFFGKSKDLILDILIRTEQSQPGYLENKIQSHIKMFEDARTDSDRYYIDQKIKDIKKTYEKLKKEIKKRQAEALNISLQCGKIFED